MKPGHYTFFFWIIWFLLAPFLLKSIPARWGIICIITYPLIGVGFYFLIPLVFSAYFDKVEEKRFKGQQAVEQNKKQFFKEQYLRKKYRYIKLDNKDKIINSNEIEKEDKALILEIIHGCTPEEISKLLEKTKS